MSDHAGNEKRREFRYDNPEVLRDLYNEAIEERDSRLNRIEERIERLTGSGYIGDPAADLQYVNHQYAFLSVMMPRASSGTPKVKVKTTKGGIHSDIARAHQFYGTRWARKGLSSKFRSRLFMDYSMYWGVSCVTFDLVHDDPRDPERETIRPRADRVRPDRFFMDPLAEEWHEAAYFGHVWVKPRDQLIKDHENDKSWDMDAVKKIDTEAAWREIHDDTNASYANRDDVVGMDWWFPKWQLDPELGPSEGFNGTVLTTAYMESDKGMVVICKPKPFYGPPEGPYILGGYMPVPRCPWPLSPLSASEPLELALAEAQAQVNRAIKQYRRIVLVPAGTTENPDSAGKTIAFAPSDCVIEVPGMPADSAPVAVEIGGVTDLMLKNLAVMREQLQTQAGLDSAQVGDVVGRGTATEHAIADAGAQTRMSGVLDGFRDMLNEIVRRVLWYAYYSDNLVSQLGDEAAEEMGMTNPFFDSGAFDPEESGSFENVIDCEIEVMSVERVTEPLHQQRIDRAVERMMGLAAAARQFPEWDWERALDMIGDSLGLPAMSGMWSREAALMLMGLEAGQLPTPGGDDNQPRLGTDAGIMPLASGVSPRVRRRISQTGYTRGAQASESSGAAPAARARTIRDG